jgi:Fe(3+) dicitrate transport protein
MKKHFSLLILGAWLGRIALAQNASISGYIHAENGNSPLSYVNIALNTNIGTQTDEKGNFRIDNLSPGEYDVFISYIGFERFMLENIKINNQNEEVNLGEIKLKPRSVQISEVTVSAISKQYQEKFKGSNTVITKAHIEQTQPVGTEEVLKTVAGVNVSGDMGISNRLNIGIRGSYPRRSGNILILEDGTPIAPAPYLGPEAYYNPPSDRLDGIEIVKGADILTFGPNSSYGMINYITKRPPLKPTLGINLTSGENGYQSQFITYGGTWNNIGAELQVLNKSFDGFQQNSQSHIFNTTAKVYADLGKKSSAYIKLNYHQENSKASYSSLTPLSYSLDPRQNPFDADDLETKRYAVDMVYNYKINSNIVLSSKVYGSQFQRDWWRQENTLVHASKVRDYVGEDIYNQKFSYLEGQNFTDDDWVRVGRINNRGREMARARNRLFMYVGIQETIKSNWKAGDLMGELEIGLKHHREQFNDLEFMNDSSRFARSGRLVKENKFLLSANSVHIKNTFKYGNLSFSPALRYEVVEMHGFDQMKIAQDAENDGSKYFGSNKNTFTTLLPGATINYKFISTPKNDLAFYAGAYQGFTPPTSAVGFMRVDNGEVSKPADDEQPNMQAETSTNYEAGLRGNVLNGVQFQSAYFNNNINNFYSAGRQEAFQTLGSVNIQGIETAVNIDLSNLLKITKHDLNIGASVTAMNSRIVSGVLSDTDILKAKHTDASKEEIINKINAERGGFNVYFANDSLITRELSVDDFSKIKNLEYVFGKDGIANNAAPYIPTHIMNFNFSYRFKGFALGANYNMVSVQYTDYLNLESETGEGAVGKLPAFRTIDINTSYSFENMKNKYIKGLTFFATGKNITNEIYMASRLHRVSSGIMPGGFRQINLGLRWNI